MDEVLATSGQGLGESAVAGDPNGALAYADDLVLVANSPSELQAKLKGLTKGLREAGMALNIAKCRSMTIRKLGKRKLVVLEPHSYKIGGEVIPPMMPSEEVRYLGLPFTWKGRKPPKTTTKLEAMIAEISKAPLKPQQRIRILCDFALKKIEYEMVLGNAHRNTIKAVDGMVREAIRRWLRLPKDTSMAFLYVSSTDGGMGVPQMGITIPLAQREKFRRLLTSPDEWIRSLATDDAVLVDKRVASLPIRVGNTEVGNRAEAVQAWRSQYTEMLDLKGVRMDLMDKSSTLWGA
ncbi:unnamed protein product [Dicrocoelium dendriticum]|nr:unnamed protein product [Dicrocoelium dendriticum]